MPRDSQTAIAGQMIPVSRGQIHALATGSGPDLVLIHGANGNLRDFTFDLVDRLSGDFRVIAMDRPGFGHSTHPDAANLSPIEQAALLREAAVALGAERPIVLGHSYGGAVAMGWALNAPGAVAGLTLLAPATHPWPGELGLWYRLSASALGQNVVLPLVAALAPRRAVESSLTGVFAPDPVPAGYLDHLGLDLTLRAEQLAVNAIQVDTLKGHVTEMAQDYPDLPMPIEILHGTEDTTVGLQFHAEEMIAHVPVARLERLEGVGHMPHHARPDAVVAAVHRTAERAGLRRASAAGQR